ncbi:acyltransferase [Mucilaginibacter mali]|uniref:Acyltransferase n=1 Tax=Mucilaginibacter mali TaxID=2740462 RepID=A0A7D4PRL3_9SPHI|nr:acyltransferase [Mucilaginibacter mali]QKJ28243.1 acyltransferase [Mucilaginibacter mali]
MSTTHRIAEIDGLRGIAALMVCLLHFNLFKYGGTGVQLFFMISGFVIYMSTVYANTFKRFWIGRFTRLYPVYLLSIVITLIFYPVNFKAIRINEIIGNLTLLQPLFRANFLIFVYWTLYIEILFYFLISILLKFKLLAEIEKVILCLYCLIATTTIIYILIGDSSPVYTRYFVIFRGIVQVYSFFHLFAAGIVFYRIYHHGATRFRVLLIILSFLMTLLLTYDTVEKTLDLTDKRIISALIFYPAFILIVNRKAAFLNYSPLQFLGKISYALYVIHASFGVWLRDLLLPRTGLVAAGLISLVFTILFSYIITRFYDEPIRAALKRYFKKA